MGNQRNSEMVASNDSDSEGQVWALEVMFRLLADGRDLGEIPSALAQAPGGLDGGENYDWTGDPSVRSGSGGEPLEALLQRWEVRTANDLRALVTQVAAAMAAAALAYARHQHQGAAANEPALSPAMLFTACADIDSALWIDLTA